MTFRTKAYLMALACAPLLLSGCAKLKAKAAYQDGNKQFKLENYKDAIDKYQQAVKLDPNMAEAWFYLANSEQALYRPGKPDPANRARLDEALKAYQKSLEVNKQENKGMKGLRRNTLVALVQIYSEDPYKNYDQALAYAQDLVADNPDSAQNLFAIANLYEKFGKVSLAEEAYRKAFDLNPQDEKACSALAAFLNKPLWDGQARFEEAVTTLETCASLTPDDPAGYYKVATYYWDKAFRDPMLSDAQKDAYADKGMAAVDKALDIDPDYCDALIYKGLLLRVKAQVAQRGRDRAQFLDQADAVRKMALECKKNTQASATPTE